MDDETQPTETQVLRTPDEAFEAIALDSEEAGGAWKPAPGTEGCIGYTMFDTRSSEDGSITVLMPNENIDGLPAQALVRIASRGDERTYLGAVIEGPFAEPDGLSAESTPMVVTTVKGGLLMPKYHGRAQIELLGERVAEGAILPPRRRPRPNSPVFVLDAAETSEVLKITGDLRFGLAEGFDDLAVAVPARSKNVLPRHLGILGTTGGGKSTTVSGLVSKAQREKIAVVLIDTEGEYCAIDQPTDDPDMLVALKRRGLEAAGVDDTYVYYPIGKVPSNASHPRLAPFSLRFSELSPFALKEILDLTDAQETRFLKAYDAAKLALERMGVWPSNEREREELIELDELETGYPKMTLSHLYDVIREIDATIGPGDAEPYLETEIFRDRRDQLRQIIRTLDPPKHVPSWRALMGKIGKIKRLKIFDSPQASPLDYRDMLEPGRVSILDLGDTESPQIRNLVIAELLRGIQAQQEESYKVAVKAGRQPTPTLIFIEEAHEFLSAQRIKKMEVLFQQVARIARRGRKRWLGLVFVTQLPQHLPDEVLGLINNWILHQLIDAGVVSRLKHSIGGINEGLWRNLPSLAPGQAVVSFTSLTRALQISVDPTPCKLLMVE